MSSSLLRAVQCSILLWTGALTGCMVIPIPHLRLHAYGVKTQVIDTEDGHEIANATIKASVFSEKAIAAQSDRSGHFEIAPVYRWHGAYFIGVISQSIWPGFDMTDFHRQIEVSAPGYYARIFVVQPDGSPIFKTNPATDGPITATSAIKGDYLLAEPLKLVPVQMP